MSTSNSFGSFADSIATIFADQSTSSSVIPSDLVLDNLTVDINTFYVDSVNNRIGVNNLSPTVALDVTGAIKSSSTITGTSLAGTLTTAVQTNITSIGTQTTDLNMGTKNITNVGTLAGTLTTAAQPNITSLGTQVANLNMGLMNINNVGTLSAFAIPMIYNSLNLGAYSANNPAKGIFFRGTDGVDFQEGGAGAYNLSLTTFDSSNGGASPDGLSINAFDGIRFVTNSGSAATTIPMQISRLGDTTFSGKVTGKQLVCTSTASVTVPLECRRANGNLGVAAVEDASGNWALYIRNATEGLETRIDSKSNSFFNSPVAFGASTVNTCAQVELASTTKGFLPPRMTTNQKELLGSPIAGLIVYDTTLNCPSWYNGTKWIDQFTHITRVRGVLSGLIFNRTAIGNIYDGFISSMEQYSSTTFNDIGFIWTCPKDGWYNVQISGHTVDSATSGRLDFILTISGVGDIEINDYTFAETAPTQLDKPVFAETMKFTSGQTMKPCHHSATVRKYGFINLVITYAAPI